MSKQGKLNKKKLAWVVGIPAWYLLWLALIAWVPGFHEALNEWSDGHSEPTWSLAISMSYIGAVGVFVGIVIVSLCKKSAKSFWSWLHK